MDNTYDKFARVAKRLNMIRQEAQAKDGYIVLRPNSAEWDAIFFAEEYFRSTAEKLELLSNLTRSV